MIDRREFTDIDLTAYLDGEADPATVQQINLALEQDKNLVARLEALTIPSSEITASFDDLLSSAPAIPPLPKTNADHEPLKSSPQPKLFLKLGSPLIAASLVVGIGLGYWAAKTPTAAVSWMGYAAAYQSLYVNETLSEVEISEADKHQSLTRLGARLGRDISAAQNDDALQFGRAQLLGYKGEDLIQLAYLDPDGNPMALCITPSRNSDNTTVQITTLEGMAAAQWIDEGMAFLLIGGTNPTLIESAAKRLKASI
ncbi:putative transmembrane anti-sigma factor [Roseibium sp. TrichSKD4]|uniref:anti-sigma factor n=1 Tax=Roseibium sp. TrichSKD4 TaxID=744980 RepID=UPI0001E56E50|nr:anti-sigma factor [Roseibium sp. TrichSKD4]EFO30322.1 putative transmembrane anti-sigma factor [Roseibium sp. TrichSKD4]